MSYELGQVEISDLLTNNPTLASIVQNALASNQWPNGNPVCPVAPGWFSSGSPTAIGYSISDDTYGSVMVACDANGVLRYNVGSFNDFLACLGSTVSTVEMILIGVGVYLVWREIK